MNISSTPDGGFQTLIFILWFCVSLHGCQQLCLSQDGCKQSRLIVTQLQCCCTAAWHQLV